MNKSIKNRCFSKRETKALVITSVLLAIMLGCGHDRTDTGNIPPNKTDVLCTTITTKNTNTTVQVNCTSTKTTENTTTITSDDTASEINSMPLPLSTNNTYVVTTTVSIEIDTDENYEVQYIENCDSNSYNSDLPITEQEFILLANVISHEAGCSWLSEYDRACIVAAIVNRVEDNRFPSSIDAVVHQPYQMFDVPYYRVDYSTLPREEIDKAIYAYYNGTYDFGSINSWSGDGTRNYFYYQ